MADTFQTKKNQGKLDDYFLQINRLGDRKERKNIQVLSARFHPTDILSMRILSGLRKQNFERVVWDRSLENLTGSSLDCHMQYSTIKTLS